MTRHARGIYLIILVAVLANSVLWLDSFERYLNGRYHVYLSEYLPDTAFTPSRVLREAMAPDDYLAVSASITPIVRPVRVAQPVVIAAVPPLAASSPASAGADLPASSVAASESQAVALKVETELSRVPVEGRAEQQDLALADPNPKVLFAGDSMMQGVAPMVISRMRKDYPKGVFVDLSKPSTGLVARRYFDWPTKIREESVKHGIQVIVMFLGPNDPWDIYEGKKRYAFPSEDWEERYRSRVDEVLDFARVSGIRVIWIGLPVMREERIKQGAKIENRIFQDEVQKYKFDYLPTEDLLGSLDDPYSKYIDDPKKGKLAVRLDDGVHFTLLGLRMISSRVD
ncbi:MAG TPA: hypothetical protein VFR06_05680, partial [Gallionellaceae bacterium]|nr:hypothetical protein [Gallionellaceae bacterium]